MGVAVPSIDELTAMAESIEDEQHRALFIISYLSAGRVSEVLSLTRGQIRIEAEEDADGSIHKHMVFTHMINRKNPNKHTKSPISPLDHEADLVGLILPFINGFKKSEMLFPITPKKAWKIIKKLGKGLGLAGCFPHYLRHIRLTHLETIYNMPMAQLCEFAGWSSAQPAQYYMEIHPSDLMRAMR